MKQVAIEFARQSTHKRSKRKPILIIKTYKAGILVFLQRPHSCYNMLVQLLDPTPLADK